MPGADFLQLDPTAAPPGQLSGWLAAALRSAIADGRLTVGTRLPATRGLAAELGVSRGVVVEAYRRLSDDGRLVGRRGGGTVVASGVPGVRQRPAPATARATALDLSPGVPDLSAFPRTTWLRAEREVLTRAPAGDLGYGDPRGTQALRTRLAGWLGRARGVRADPEDLLIVSGVAQALALLAQVLTARGSTMVATEDPGSRGIRDQLSQWGLGAVPVPVDSGGLDVTALQRTGVDTVLVTPAHQFPTGVVLAPARRRKLAAWAAAGGLVMEDDYDAEHRYDRPPVAALQGLAPDQVVYTGSLSKTLAPALRLGWLVAPRRLRDALVDAKRLADLGSPTLPQLTFARLLETGTYDRHLRQVRARQRLRRDTMLDQLHRYLPQGQVHGVAAGLHLLVTLPEGTDDLALAERASATGVTVQPLSRHRQRPGPPGLVLGYAAQTPDRIRDAIRRLAAEL